MKRICSFSIVIIMLLFLTYSCEKPLDLSTLPELTTTEVSIVTEATAQSGGFISSDAGYEVTARGVCWSTTPNPSLTDSITKDAAGTGRFISKINGLTPNTTYYLRAYATNKNGTAYGLQEVFTTRALGLTTTEVTEITVNSAKSGGNIAIAGDSSNIIARGVCWDTQTNPTIQNNKTTDGEGIGLYSSLLTDLVINTTYYVRSYITNSSGTYYGNEISFTTRNGEISLTTNSVTSIMEQSAISGGNITDDGGSSITNRGVCWSTNPSPTTANYKTSNDFGTGEYVSSISNLTESTKYYIRAYATNSIGTYYGNELIFTTKKYVDLCDDETSKVTELIENFNEVVNNSDVDLAGWKVISVEGDRNWQGKVYTSGAVTETYVQATAHNGTNASYEYWLVTPPLNLDAADSKNFSFSSSKAYWTATSSLKVYVLKCVDGVTTRTEITKANIAKQSDTDHTFVSSGNIDLSSFSGSVYIGFQYIALGGANNSTTFKIDNVMFNVLNTTVDVKSSAPTSAEVGEAYSYNITTNVVNPKGATTITATGLPSWATFTDNGDGTASIVGTPDAVGSHIINIKATNNSISDSQVYTLVVTESTIGQNLIVNPGFEDWISDLPTGWDNATYNTGIVKETTIVRSGSNSVKHISTSSALKIQQEVEVTGGKTYNISYWYLDNSPKAKTRSWSYWVAGTSTLTDHATSLRPDSYSTDNTEWVKAEFTLTAPATATKLRFEVRTYRESTTLDGDPIFYDDFSVKEIL